jgi:CBS domain containing-hemolysin-like protein
MSVLNWAIIIALILVNALYVAAEFAAVSARRSRIRRLADEGNRRARLLMPILLDAARLDRYVAACQIGITLSSLVLGAFSQATLAKELVPLFAGLGGLQEAAAQSTSAIVVLVGLTILQVVFGELVPKSLALQHSTAVALFTFTPMRWSLVLLSGAIAVLNGSGLLILKWMRIPHGGHRHIHSPEEIEFLIAESRDGGVLEEDEHRRLQAALRLASRTAGQLMVPRRHMVAVEAHEPLDVVLDRIAGSPYTRVPVYDGSLDNILGVIHTKDLVTRHLESDGITSLAEVMRPAVFVPENLSVDRLLAVLREKRRHQAIVIDEYGGVEGLVTLEDVLSGLLGGVGDEFKDGQREPERLPDGRVRLPGMMRVDGVERWTGLRLHGEAATIGGFVTGSLGRIPAPGDRAVIDGATVEVESMDGHAVVSVLVTPAAAATEDR